MRPLGLRGVGVERMRGRLTAVFTLSEVPDQDWIAFFRERARYIRVSPAGIREAGTHDIIEVKTGSS